MTSTGHGKDLVLAQGPTCNMVVSTRPLCPMRAVHRGGGARRSPRLYISRSIWPAQSCACACKARGGSGRGDTTFSALPVGCRVQRAGIHVVTARATGATSWVQTPAAAATATATAAATSAANVKPQPGNAKRISFIEQHFPRR